MFLTKTTRVAAAALLTSVGLASAALSSSATTISPCDLPGNVIDGTSGDDVLYGTTGRDIIHGRGGNDTIYGKAGNDSLYGQNGYDTIIGGNGADCLFGGADNDALSGDGNSVSSDVTDDTIDGGAGEDDEGWYSETDESSSVERGKY
jgi:hypothetical protein